MTNKLRSVSEVVEGFRTKYAGKLFDLAGYRAERAPATYCGKLLTTDRAHIATVLIAGLEELKKQTYNPPGTTAPAIHGRARIEAYDDAIALIRTTLDVTSEEK